MKTVAVGMSGGVDSSVSALILKKQGYRVIGLFMKNWEEEGDCLAKKDYEDVVKVCSFLNIPYYNVNFVQEYRKSVFSQFLQDLQKGFTPNPDILCNREIKFNIFLKKALELGVDFLATGHYCQLDREFKLLRGVDSNKDQSYFLHAVKQASFEKVLFPIGHLTKQEVRKIALNEHLATAKKKDSTGICFIGKRHFKSFLARFLKPKPGNFKTLSGKIVGTHDGAFFYTIGQRKGMGLSSDGNAWYVVDKDIFHNIVYIEKGADHPALFSQKLKTENLTWVAQKPKSFPFPCTAKIRYRQEDQLCTLLESGEVLFKKPQRAITPGQSIVFYDGKFCLGGGLIISKSA